MKNHFFFTLLLVVIYGCSQKSEIASKPIPTHTQKTDTTKTDTIKEKKVIEPASIDTVLLGDINNDKIKDTAFVYTPPTFKYLNEKGEVMYYHGCVDNKCYNKISFSCKMPEIYYDISVWGSIENIGDLDNDGYNELIFSPGWFTSCWGALYIYSFDGKKWNQSTKVTYRRCDEGTLKSHVLKIKNNYYLKGLTFEDGDDKEYKVKIKLK